MVSSLEVSAKKTELWLGEKISDILGDIKSIKDTMLDLEKGISIADEAEGIRLQTSLRAKSGELNDLSDSIVVISREAWGKYNELAQLFVSQGIDLNMLEPVRLLCKRIEVIAADLLCFSLAH